MAAQPKPRPARQVAEPQSRAAAAAVRALGPGAASAFLPLFTEDDVLAPANVVATVPRLGDVLNGDVLTALPPLYQIPANWASEHVTALERHRAGAPAGDKLPSESDEDAALDIVANRSSRITAAGVLCRRLRRLSRGLRKTSSVIGRGRAHKASGSPERSASLKLALAAEAAAVAAARHDAAAAAAAAARQAADDLRMQVAATEKAIAELSRRRAALERELTSTRAAESAAAAEEAEWAAEEQAALTAATAAQEQMQADPEDEVGRALADADLIDERTVQLIAEMRRLTDELVAENQNENENLGSEDDLEDE